MEIFYAVCAGVFVVVFMVVAVFFILTLVQVRQTARAVQILAESANREMGRLQSMGQAASAAAALFSGSMGNVVSVGVQLINSFLKRREKRSSEEDNNKPE